MTEAKPLSDEEIASAKHGVYTQGYIAFGPRWREVMNLIATIDQRDEQIKRLREALNEIAHPLAIQNIFGTGTKRALEIIAELSNIARKALAATEPPK